MRRQRHEIHRPVGDVHGDLAYTLRCIGMQQHAVPPAAFSELREILNHTGFVVQMHDRNEHGRIGDSRLD